MWGFWVGLCIFPCPGFRNNLEALDEFLKLFGLKVCQGFGVGTRGGHLWLLCCWPWFLISLVLSVRGMGGGVYPEVSVGDIGKGAGGNAVLAPSPSVWLLLR